MVSFVFLHTVPRTNVREDTHRHTAKTRTAKLNKDKQASIQSVEGEKKTLCGKACGQHGNSTQKLIPKLRIMS